MQALPARKWSACPGASVHTSVRIPATRSTRLNLTGSVLAALWDLPDQTGPETRLESLLFFNEYLIFITRVNIDETRQGIYL